MLAAVLPDIGHSFREAFFMFWETLWPIVLGFGLSGAVQAFVSREEMQRTLGNHRPAAVAKASGLGMVSSSCSYAASAMAKSIFDKGADFIASMVFMFASTNLVVELGIVLVILMGWQFAAAEFVGGPIMIILLVTLGGFVLTPRVVAAARARASSRDGGSSDRASEASVAADPQSEVGAGAWRKKLFSRAAWSDAASYTIADLKMLRRELVIGYLVAGFLAVLVPSGAWNAIFIRGHGGWTVVENAIVGPIIAFASFVCSIGNVPMAAALWKGGISFGGVVSFLFADLVAAPLVLIYRRYYGGPLTLRLVLLFWVVMAGAGLIVEEIFAAARLVPRRRPTEIAAITFHWNYTAVLNIVALVVFGYLYWMYRNRARFGGGVGYALDPVCGMQVRISDAPATGVHQGRQYWFCSDHCAERFASSPARFTGGAGSAGEQGDMEETMAKDPVCGMSVDPAGAAAIRTYHGRNYFFCSIGCAEAFDVDPARYVASAVADS
jgi:YHS domain-containing protein/uncharacterized membrane protein YraQ (UPF0718 family)